MPGQFAPLRLFSPAEKIDWSCTIQTERELQLIKDIAQRNGMAIRVDLSSGKVFLGRSRLVAKTGLLSADIRDHVKPLAQSNSVSCGQTSVAVAINTMTGSQLRDTDINHEYGFALFTALAGKCPKHEWRDLGNMHPGFDWGDIISSLNWVCPVMIGLNGMFSASGHGHIVAIAAVNGDQVHYADPNGGLWKTCTRADMENCAPHPDGKFVFAAKPR